MWLEGFSDAQATLYTFSSGITTTDLAGDGDFRLIIADIGTGSIPSKLKIYKGTGLISEVILDDIPTAIAPMYIDSEQVPVITVASSDYVYVYKNLRPFFRAVLPPLPVNAVERDIWGQYTSVESLYEVLNNLKTESGISALCLKSQHFLTLAPNERSSFVETNKSMTLQRKNIITCMSTLKKSRQEETALTCLVLGTETRELLVLHPETFTPIDEARLMLAEVPVFISTSGLFDIDYTLTTTLRNGHLVLGRRGWVSPLLNMGKPAVGALCLETLIVVALLDSTLNCFSDKGRRIWRLETPGSIRCIERIQVKSKSLDLIGIGVQESVRLYSTGGELLDVFECSEPVNTLYFGQYGRERNSLAIVTSGGSLEVKILKRSAEFSAELEGKSTRGVSSKLSIPKKTKLFVDQTMRERDSSVAMHRTFQKFAFEAKLDTARQLVSVISSKQSPATLNDTVKLSARVLGLGPIFIIEIGVQNISQEGLTGISLFFHWDDRFFTISPPFINLPLITPTNELRFQTCVEAVSGNGMMDIVRVIVVENGRTILVAIINMPQKFILPLIIIRDLKK